MWSGAPQKKDRKFRVFATVWGGAGGGWEERVRADPGKSPARPPVTRAPRAPVIGVGGVHHPVAGPSSDTGERRVACHGLDDKANRVAGRKSHRQGEMIWTGTDPGPDPSIDRSRTLIVGMRTTKTAGGCDHQSVRADATRYPSA